MKKTWKKTAALLTAAAVTMGMGLTSLAEEP